MGANFGLKGGKSEGNTFAVDFGVELFFRAGAAVLWGINHEVPVCHRTLEKYGVEEPRAPATQRSKGNPSVTIFPLWGSRGAGVP